MIDHIENKKLVIHGFDQELLLTTMLEFWYYMICSSAMVYLNVISIIQCYIFSWKIVFCLQGTSGKYRKPFLLIFLVTSNSLVATVYNQFVSNIQ